jgi:hypothetical protein
MLRNEGIGADNAPGADSGAVEECRAHADQAFVPDGAGVNDGGMADGAPASDHGGKIVG